MWKRFSATLDPGEYKVFTSSKRIVFAFWDGESWWANSMPLKVDFYFEPEKGNKD
jgi:hypothetical protein